MATGALPRCRLVEEYLLALDRSESGMAEVASHFFMRAFQRKVGLPLVIELRRFPVIYAMATIAVCDLCIRIELAAMYVYVALRAFRRRGPEAYFANFSAGSGRLVALVASHFGMRSQERERRL